MTLKAQRDIALGAARSIIRKNGFSYNADTALKALDDLLRTDPHTVAAKWYGNANDSQIKLFKREWK